LQSSSNSGGELFPSKEVFTFYVQNSQDLEAYKLGRETLVKGYNNNNNKRKEPAFLPVKL
jgi:hypothetical protein